MEEVGKLRNDLTVILITHRLTTVKKCDNIFLLDKGKLVGQGTYEELYHSNLQFKTTASNLDY